MSSEDHEPLSPNKALVPYYKTSIVPPDVISRIKRESSTIEAKIRANLDNVQNKKHIAYLLIGVTVVAVSLLLHIVAGLIAGGILAFISRDHLLPEQEASFDRDQKSFATSAARTTFHCPHCSKSFNAAAPWLCGNCGNLHEQTKEKRPVWSATAPAFLSIFS